MGAPGGLWQWDTGLVGGRQELPVCPAPSCDFPEIRPEEGNIWVHPAAPREPAAVVTVPHGPRAGRRDQAWGRIFSLGKRRTLQAGCLTCAGPCCAASGAGGEKAANPSVQTGAGCGRVGTDHLDRRMLRLSVSWCPWLSFSNLDENCAMLKCRHGTNKTVILVLQMSQLLAVIALVFPAVVSRCSVGSCSLYRRCLCSEVVGDGLGVGCTPSGSWLR